ncbi:MAG: hypothetical protein Q7V31_03730 [Parvibaculum sp.]|uniref:hypothetical protein n=1 Tax=Parvibaculum sp. TaxID=2024848 RepID=UPI002726033C|nr:hypothetical protein [Parvibaculum sp.]MDO8838013.1 hypothetical protein [Parvibaculum sp.]
MQSAPLQALTFKAAGAVAAYRGVGYGGAQATVAGQKIMGVSQRAVATGEDSDAVTAGTTIIETGGEFAAGASLIVDSAGRAIAGAGALAVAAGATPVTSTAANGAAILTGSDMPQFVFADALYASGGAGELVEVKLR